MHLELLSHLWKILCSLDNSAIYGGGGIFMYEGTVFFLSHGGSIKFIRNKAHSGGGIYSKNSTIHSISIALHEYAVLQ